MVDVCGYGDLPVGTRSGGRTRHRRALSMCAICTFGHAHGDHPCERTGDPQRSRHEPADAGRNRAVPRRPATDVYAETWVQAPEAADSATAASTDCTWRASWKDGAGSPPEAIAEIRSRTSWVKVCS